jgi:hypothetical protein
MKIRTLLLLSLVFLVLVGCNPPSGNSNSATVPNSGSVVAEANKIDSQPQLAGDTAAKIGMKTPDFNQLTGDWLRTDGGKTIRINNATPDGKLDAEYFNPKPIHVGRAGWLVKEKSLIVFVELQDVNYPGSLYTLEYFPAEDELAGIYYQAVDKENYEVEFVRQK